MKDEGLLTDLAAGCYPCQAAIIQAAGVLRCLEVQQGTRVMVASVLAALGFAAIATNRGDFMVEHFRLASVGLAEDIADLTAKGVLPPPSRMGFGVELADLIERACAEYEAMTPEQKAAHDEAQRQSWARGNNWGDEGTRVVDLAAVRQKREG